MLNCLTFGALLSGIEGRRVVSPGLKMSECQTKAGNQQHSLTHSLSTYCTTFVFMSMLKSHCLVFIGENANCSFGTSSTAPHPVSFEFIELVPS